jgi:integrase
MNDCISDKKQNTGTRDAAIIALMYAGGLRRDEVIGANNYDPTTGKLVIIGKRNKQRTVYINNGAADALEDWLDLRGDGPGPIFLAINKGDKIRLGKQLSPQAIYGMLAKRAENAKVRDFSPHDLRRTFISDLLDAGVDITTVSKMAGHASVNTTARYDRRPEETKRKAAELLHVPYKRRRD